MNENLLNKIKEIKEHLSADGFQVKGVFGSYVRGEENINSDIDILYDINNEFRAKYIGFNAVKRIDDIQKIISDYLGINADLVQKQSLGNVSAKYILSEVYYVE